MFVGDDRWLRTAHQIGIAIIEAVMFLGGIAALLMLLVLADYGGRSAMKAGRVKTEMSRPPAGQNKPPF
jgi:hypothetical protein